MRQHDWTIAEVGEGAVRVIGGCGWRSEVFGAVKTLGAMDPLQRVMWRAHDAADLHEWDSELR